MATCNAPVITVHDYKLVDGDPLSGPGVVPFQLLSDLHQELACQDQFTWEVNAPYLVLCGDTANGTTSAFGDFLRKQSPRYRGIFVVPGNHEFYKNEYHGTRQAMQALEAIPNVHVLDRKTCVVEGIKLIGATLWSQTASSQLNDFTLIKIAEPDGSTRKLTPKDTTAFFQQELEFIKSEVASAKAAGQRVLVLTHHCPLRNEPGFSTDLSSFIKSNKHICVWMYGHTHYSIRTRCGSTLVISNQLGYAYQMGEVDNNFHPECVVAIKAPTGDSNVWAGNSIKRAKHLEELAMEAKMAATPTTAAPPPPPPPKKPMKKSS
ncbi:3',5'-cyclic AMP phosphodiesterase protein [Pelomyxa schiedti]|nr:3',5'-cyclic AMP phosphodiesterase protein [Pelomyxa schiedti]